MKKFLVDGLIILQLLCFLPLNVYSQSNEQSAVLGKITIDEKGQVTIQSIEKQANMPVKVFGQSGKMPQKFDYVPEGAIPIMKTESSGSDMVLNSFSDAKTISRIIDGTRSFSSTEVDLHQFYDPAMTTNPGNYGAITITSQEVRPADFIVPKFNEPGQEKLYSSAYPLPDSKGSYEENISGKGTEAGPNLTLHSGSSSLTVSETTLNISLTVINNGTGSAVASELGYYLSHDILFTTTPNYVIGTDAVTALAAGGTSAETASINVSALSIPCGTYYVFFNIDNKNQVAESNENDNAWYFTTPKVTIPCIPNLDLSSGTSSLNVTGTNVSVALTVVNNGSTTAAASVLGYYLSPDVLLTTTPNYLIGTDAVEALAVGATSAESIAVDVLASVPCGTYYVIFKIDHTDQVTESNENDNVWYFTSPKVTIPCLPNLDLSSGTASLNVTGTSVSVALTVINNGSQSAAASELGYYLSPDVVLTTTPNYLIGTDAVGALAVSGTSAESITVDVAASSIPCGTYYVIFKIDNLDQVTESNENDNVFYWSTPKVTIPCVPNLDLASGTASINVNGTNVTVNLTVINNGSSSAAASILGYYLSPDVSLTTAPNYLIGTDAVETLAVGATSAETVTVDVSTSSVPCGTYYVIFKFDHTDQVTESNEIDNIWYFSSPNVTIPCVPNLDLKSGTSSINIIGTNVSVSVTVINNGSSTAAASEMGYYLSPDISFTTTPNYLIGTDPVSALAVGGTSAESLALDVTTVAPPIPAGSYYVFFVFDHLNTITEVNEIDNTWYFTSPRVTISETTGVNEIFKTEDDLRIYPNPTDGRVIISSASLSPEGAKVTVINSLGKVIFERIIDSDMYEIDLSGNSGGLYYLKIEANSWSYTGKVVLNK